MGRKCRRCSQRTGPKRRLCKSCAREERFDGRPSPTTPLETVDGEPVRSWVDVDGTWHASIAFDGHEHVFACGTVFTAFPADAVTQYLGRLEPDTVCPDCRAALDHETIPGPWARAIFHEDTTMTTDETTTTEEQNNELIADGGVDWIDLTGFQRDILEAISRLERDGEKCHGLGIRDVLERQYEEVHHGRLYPNLDRLVNCGFVEKRVLDKRTNEYTLTDEGRAVLRERVEALAEACDLAVAATDGTGEASIADHSASEDER
ncbi:PadR family transcriptional regulator [Natrarchaeobaculum aegyptiacum]|uniref:PadR family transcriptional regulator n=1 Tax=Natrarchaeobaculum aegyptiacum TaxID=745377 RepID=UPI001E29B344|nr:PadR family transcriptional regulator [Natrarchaeobaculum aegyptiacum]